jgi:Fe-S oxidoreductase
MHPNRKDSQCCGAGGGVLSAFDKLSAKVAINTLERAKNSGAEILVTSCPACYINFKRAVIHAKMDLEVRDIVEILNRVV